MASYRIVFKRLVAKDLRRIPIKDIRRILKRIDALADEPQPAAAEKLTGDEISRLKKGNVRILYIIEDEIIRVTIVKMGHRRNVNR